MSNKSSEVRARLDRALNKSEASIQASKVLYETKTKAEFESGLTALLAGRDFIFLAELVHHHWVRTYTESPDIPQAVVYTLGNPFFGQSVLRRAMWMGLHVPEKLLLLEDPDGNSTTIIYDEPADIIPVSAVEGHAVDEDLYRFIAGVGEKIKKLVESLIVE